MRYRPKWSVSWEGKTLRYFSHKNPESRLGWSVLAPLIWEYIGFWGDFWVRNLPRLPQLIWNILRKRLFNRKLWLQGTSRER